MKTSRSNKGVAAVAIEEDSSQSDGETSSRTAQDKAKSNKKIKKVKTPEEIAVVGTERPTVPTTTIPLPTSPPPPPPPPPPPANTATQAPSNAATYGSTGGEARRGRGRYDRGRNYGRPADSGPRRSDDNNRFVGACYLCEETGHRANQCPRRECYACRQIGHISPECPLRPHERRQTPVAKCVANQESFLQIVPGVYIEERSGETNIRTAPWIPPTCRRDNRKGKFTS